jgi:hypoxanthine phosphoribosyltransferase
MELLISEDEIREKIAELAKDIVKHYKNSKELVLVTVLRGGLDFSDDLIRELREVTDKKLILDDMIVKSYSGTKSSGTHNVEKDLKTDVKGKDVLLLEDIIDSGKTLKFLKDYFKKRGVKTVEMCTLLDKTERRTEDVNPLFIGFEIPDVFVVGYGMDFNGDFRDLKDIMILEGHERK